MKVAPQSNRKEAPREVPPLPLVPEETMEYSSKDSTKCGSFKLLLNPSDTTSTKYTFTMSYVDGSQSIRAHLKWLENVSKLLSDMELTTGPAQHNMILQLCQGQANSAYNERAVGLREERWTHLATQAHDAVI